MSEVTLGMTSDDEYQRPMPEAIEFKKHSIWQPTTPAPEGASVNHENIYIESFDEKTSIVGFCKIGKQGMTRFMHQGVFQTLYVRIKDIRFNTHDNQAEVHLDA